MLDQLAQAGNKIAVLLEPSDDPETVATGIVGADPFRKLGDLRRLHGAPVQAGDLLVTRGYYGAAKGDWRDPFHVMGDENMLSFLSHDFDLIPPFKDSCAPRHNVIALQYFRHWLAPRL